MKATCQYRQTLVQDQQNPATVLDVFPRFLDIPGLIDQDFTMMFGEEVSGKFFGKMADVLQTQAPGRLQEPDF
ncbi:hypothetical protein R3I94_018905 [Phoxinus phoxinus]|uniref:Uncharacterized protein n=1 Tax=Phoxinus phoxinus TaxID=58324 RepID=A0AAN9CPX5_9TELE